MKKKAKLIATLSSLGLALAMMVFAVYAATSVSFKVTTNVNFEATKHVQATITARDSGATDTVLTVDSANYPNKATTGADQTINVDGTGKTVDGEGNEIAGLENVVFAQAELTATNKYYGYQITIKNDDNENKLPIEVTAPTKTGTGYDVKFTGATKTTIDIGATHVITCIIEIKDLAGNKVEVKNSDMSLDIKLGEEDSSTEEELEPTLDYLIFDFVENGDDDYYKVRIYENVLSDDSFDGNIVVPNSYDDGINGVLPVKEIYNRMILINEGMDPWRQKTVMNVVIPDTIEKIGSLAFYGSSITAIDIPTSVTTIGYEAFEYCGSLTSIVIPDSVTIIESYAFSSCDKLTIFCEAESQPAGWDSTWNYDNRTVYLADEWEYDADGNPVLKTASGEGSVEEARNYIPVDALSCTYDETSKEAILTEIDYATLKQMEEAEDSTVSTYSARPMSAVVYSDGKFENGCLTLPSKTIINGQEYKVVGCSGTIGAREFPLIEDDYSVYNGPGVTITKIVIPDTYTVVGDASFSYFLDLIEVEIPDSVTIIGAAAFCDTPWIANQPAGALYINNVLYYYIGTMTDADKNFIVKDGTISISPYLFSGSSLISIEIPDSVTTIGKNTFYGCDGLTSIELPEGLTTIGDYAFYNCNGLISVEIPKSVTTIGDYAFYYCKNLSLIEIPDSVTIIGANAFENTAWFNDQPTGAIYINNILYTYKGTLVESDYNFVVKEGTVAISNSAFYDCKNLISIELPEGLTTIGDNAFYGCNSLTEVKFPEGLTTIGYSAFDGCRKLISIELPEGLTTIKNSTFSNCVGLTSIKLPNSLKTIDHYAFFNCYSLSSIELPEGLTTIGAYAFYECNGLTKIVIPDSVTTIASDAFIFSTELTVYCEAESQPKGWGANWNSADYEAISKIPVYWAGEWEYDANGKPKLVTEEGATHEYLSFDFIDNGEDDKYYSVSLDPNSISNSEDFDGNIVIPSFYSDGINGKYPVKSTHVYGEDILRHTYTNVKSLTIPNTITNIEGFWYTSITELEIPNSVTYIGNSALFGNSSLEYIVIPDSVVNVESDAFGDVIGNIYIDKTEEETLSWNEGWCNRHRGSIYYKGEWEYDSDGKPTPITINVDPAEAYVLTIQASTNVFPGSLTIEISAEGMSKYSKVLVADYGSDRTMEDSIYIPKNVEVTVYVQSACSGVSFEGGGSASLIKNGEEIQKVYTNGDSWVQDLTFTYTMDSNLTLVIFGGDSNH